MNFSSKKIALGFGLLAIIALVSWNLDLRNKSNDYQAALQSEMKESSIIIKDKALGKIVDQIPYKFYPIGDIFIDHMFTNSSEYEIFLLAKINDDPKYATKPLMTKFDISVREPQKGLLGSVFDFFNPS